MHDWEYDWEYDWGKFSFQWKYRGKYSLTQSWLYRFNFTIFENKR